jgi:hypothetical protein
VLEKVKDHKIRKFIQNFIERFSQSDQEMFKIARFFLVEKILLEFTPEFIKEEG